VSSPTRPLEEQAEPPNSEHLDAEAAAPLDANGLALIAEAVDEEGAVNGEWNGEAAEKLLAADEALDHDDAADVGVVTLLS